MSVPQRLRRFAPLAVLLTAAAAAAPLPARHLSALAFSSVAAATATNAERTAAAASSAPDSSSFKYPKCRPMSTTEKKSFSAQELRARLSEEQIRVTQGCGTERAFTGKYYKHKADGTYVCVVCEEPLFDSTTKYDSGSGWPSFVAPIGSNVEERVDRSHGMVRREVLCRKCGAHLGHVFDDGPRDRTGLRFCINSASLDFKARSSDAAGGSGSA